MTATTQPMRLAAAAWLREAWPQGRLMAILRRACTHVEQRGLRPYAGPLPLTVEPAGTGHVLQASFQFDCSGTTLTLQLDWWLGTQPAEFGETSCWAHLRHGDVSLVKGSLWQRSALAPVPPASEVGSCLEQNFADLFEEPGLTLLEGWLTQFAERLDTELAL